MRLLNQATSNLTGNHSGTCSNMTNLNVQLSNELTPIFMINEHGQIVEMNRIALNGRDFKQIRRKLFTSEVFLDQTNPNAPKAFFQKKWYGIRKEKIYRKNHPLFMMTLTRSKSYPDKKTLQNVKRMSEVLVHRIRSPLTGMQGYIDLMMESDSGVDQTNKARLQKTEQGIHYLFEMMDNLKQIYDLETESGSADSKESHIQSVLTELEDCIPDHRWKSVTIHKSSEMDTFQADQTTLVSILTILLHNAWDHQKGEESVEITFNSDYSLTISNYGDTIPEPMCHEIFQPYVTTRADRMGLGLTVAHMYASQLNGIVYLSQNSDGKISFTFTTVPNSALNSLNLK